MKKNYIMVSESPRIFLNLDSLKFFPGNFLCRDNTTQLQYDDLWNQADTPLLKSGWLETLLFVTKPAGVLTAYIIGRRGWDQLIENTLDYFYKYIWLLH